MRSTLQFKPKFKLIFIYPMRMPSLMGSKTGLLLDKGNAENELMHDIPVLNTVS